MAEKGTLTPETINIVLLKNSTVREYTTRLM
jgi:hypothetical protein